MLVSGDGCIEHAFMCVAMLAKKGKYDGSIRLELAIQGLDTLESLCMDKDLYYSAILGEGYTDVRRALGAADFDPFRTFRHLQLQESDLKSIIQLFVAFTHGPKLRTLMTKPHYNIIRCLDQFEFGRIRKELLLEIA